MYCNFLIMTDHAYLVARVCARATGSTAGFPAKEDDETASGYGHLIRASPAPAGLILTRL